MFEEKMTNETAENVESPDVTKEITDPGTDNGESILTTTKKLLGIEEDCKEFDLDVMLNINAAIFTLRQLGVGPKSGFTVTSKEETYEDYLSDRPDLINEVKMYFYYKTRLGFDPPSSSVVTECIKEMIREAEFRLNIEVDPEEIFSGG